MMDALILSDRKTDMFFVSGKNEQKSCSVSLSGGGDKSSYFEQNHFKSRILENKNIKPKKKKTTEP